LEAEHKMDFFFLRQSTGGRFAKGQCPRARKFPGHKGRKGRIFVGLTGLVWTNLCLALWAQNTLVEVLETPQALSAHQQEELYRQLQKQAEYWERQAAIVKTVVKLVRPTVVHIEAEPGIPSLPQRPGTQRVEEAGSGVIVQIQGKFYVLTNRHVIKGSGIGGIKISLADGRRIFPTRLWDDPESDVAVLAVDAPGLTPARLGKSKEVEIGDFVLAVGSPFGLSHSVTFGIISAKGRRDLELGHAEVVFQDFLQTDAAINPGNSGGPLINLRGEVIGINTAIASNSGGNEGIGFAIPIDMFMFVANQLIEKGKVDRAFLGVHLDSRFGPAMAAEVGLPRPIGARISGITPQSPAAGAGLQVGDIILQFDGQLVEDAGHLINLVATTPVGKKVPLVLFRDRKTLSLEVTLADRAQFLPKQ
jgi:serine protease Do